MKKASKIPDNAPWWRFPIVWLVVGGPAIVVVAALAMVVVAYRDADVVLDTAAGTGTTQR
ncbi:MAG: hypothetical protein KGL43_28390 [Burkholderiales bacterium]|nr:hypothetical protein [Burkholderiales bacterium]MDE2396622.1 hypothetical protein [Burkholderiales bacterium]MDE2457530.1 hypothetical protein [Burkholderiales bacterium]